MGRLITYDNYVQDQVNLIIKKKDSQSGLIIGQCTDQKDFVIRLCPTPKNEDSQIIADDSKKKSKPKDTISFNLDESWICQHAKQLMRALPGGFDILGFYFVLPSDQSIKQQAQLRQVLFGIYKILCKSSKFTLYSKDRVLLNICPVTFKITCRTFDILDFKSSATPAEWKMQPGTLRWQRLHCRIALDIKFPIRGEDSGLSLQKQIEKGLSSFFNSVSEAHVLLNGVRREQEELLDSTLESKKSSRKKQNKEKDGDISSSDWHEVDLFLPLETNNNTSPEMFDSIYMMTFKGMMQCRAYVHGKATVQESINALKQDIVRSITSRCEIHCEDLLVIEEEQKDPLVVHELPRRVFAPLPQADITVCDYQFHSDTPADSLDAFKELLNLDLTEEDIDTSCEVSPTTSTLILPEVTEDRLSEFGDTPKHSSVNPLIPVLGIAATIAAGVASMLYASSSNS